MDVTIVMIHTSLILKLFYILYIYIYGRGLVRDDSAPIPRAQGLTEWVVEDENDVDYMLWPSQSPNPNELRRFLLSPAPTDG